MNSHEDVPCHRAAGKRRRQDRAPVAGTATPRRGLAIDSTLTAVTNIISSVKALAAYTKEVERFATRDPLTNLYNQISFWDLLEYETNRSSVSNTGFPPRDRPR
jgi:GGDEF domain-containing protein